MTSSGNFIRVQVRGEKRRQASSRGRKNVGIKGLFSFFVKTEQSGLSKISNKAINSSEILLEVIDPASHCDSVLHPDLIQSVPKLVIQI